MDRKRQERGLDLEAILNPRSSISSVQTFVHILWLKKWSLLTAWLVIALPAAVFLAFYDIPRRFESSTYLRFPRVVGAQNTVARDVSLGESESVVRLFSSQKVMFKTIAELGLQFQLRTKNVFRAQVIDTIRYGQATLPGKYRFEFPGNGRVKVTARPWGVPEPQVVFDSVVGPKGEVAFGDAVIRFKPGLLAGPRGIRLDMLFLTPDEALLDLAGRLKVSPLDEGGVAVNYEVTLEDRDPFLVADVVNSLTGNFLDVYQGTSRTQDREVLQRLESGIAQAKENLARSQARLAAFYERNQARMAVKEGNPFALSTAQAQKTQIETALERLDQSMEGRPAESAPEEEKRLWVGEVLTLLSGHGVQRAEALRSRLDALERKRAELAATLNPNHPYLKEAEREMAELYPSVVQMAEATRRNYQSKVVALAGEIWRNMPGGSANMSLELEARRLTDERDNHTRTLDNLQSEYNRAKLSAGPDLFQVSVIDPARPPLYQPPTLQTRLGFSAAAFVLAIFPGLFWILAAQVLFPRIWNKDDAERKLKIKVLGSLFHMGAKPARRPPLLSPEGLPVDDHLLHFGRLPTHSDVESYRSLRVEIENFFGMPANGGGFCLVVTSSQPNEGKSVTSANLAVGFARRGKRTLLVDADFRHGCQETVFGHGSGRGLADLLREGVDADFGRKLEQCLLATPQANLTLMPKGRFDESATEAAYRAPMEAFVGAAKAAFEVVVVDTAPVIVTADALGLAPLVRGVLFVIRSGVVSSREATRALEPFRDRDVLLAAVVNGIRRSPADDNFYHKYGYYYVVPPATGGNPSGAGSGQRGPDPAPKPDPREVPINS